MRKLLIVAAAVALVASMGANPVLRSIVLEVAQDSYVVADLVAPKETVNADGTIELVPNPVMDQNFGEVAFIRVWYDATNPEERRLLSVVLLKFDLEPLKNLDVESVSLQAYSIRANLIQPTRLVDVALVVDDWSESQVTYNSRPGWNATPIATNAVFGANRWYSWDVTAAVKAATRSESLPSVSFIMGLRSSQLEQEEQVVFAAKETGQNIPRLVVTYSYELVIAWWIWAIGIGVAALLAFIIGVWVSRRKRPAALAEVTTSPSSAA